MSEAEKKHSISDFQEPVQQDDEEYWTDDDLREIKKKIIERLGLDGKQM